MAWLLSLALWKLFFLAYASVEIGFYIVYILYLVPYANRRTQPQEYRDYGRDRHRLFTRILDRMERTCVSTNQDIRQVLEDYFSDWFHRHSTNSFATIPFLSLSSSSSEDVGNDETKTPLVEWCIESLNKEDADEFLSWAFFGKLVDDLMDWENRELLKLHRTLRNRYDLVFEPGQSGIQKARRMSLEDMNPLHRPLLLYMLVGFLKCLGGLLLRVVGFRRYVTTFGLVYWYRGRKLSRESNQLPLLFFHGIAPGGLTFYIPMVLWGLAGNGQDAFLFENRPISCSLRFRALSEEETVSGVIEALDRHLEHDASVSLCGHSFGSCSVTWLLHSEIQSRISQVVLLDPVTILLSTADVMNNFLYSNQLKSPNGGSKVDQLWLSFHRAKIRLFASSDLLTEWYLRRHFAWYNSELWLEDIPPQVQVVVCLSERDEVINATTVRKEIDLHNLRTTDLAKIELINWKGTCHAHCLASPSQWKQIQERMIEQEGAVQ